MPHFRFTHLLLAGLFCLPLTGAGEEEDSVSLRYVLDRYIDQMGGRANLQKIQSVRLRGTISYPDGTSHSVTVLKKKPDLVRITVNTGAWLLVQGYDGEVAWFARQKGRDQIVDRMKGTIKENFIRDAPLESILVNVRNSGAALELGENTIIDETPCYQIIATFPGGARTIHFLEMNEYTEHRIRLYNSEGKLVTDLSPSKFELFEGVLFAMENIRYDGDSVVSKLEISEVDINIGILDTAFSPPAELPPL